MQITQTTKQLTRPFARIGEWKTVKTQIADARANGATVEGDRETGIVKVSFGDAYLFKALQKSGKIWLVMYSREFYSPDPVAV